MAKKIKIYPTPQNKDSFDAVILGEFVRARRTQSGLGIHDAAALCGVAVDTLNKIENAKGDVMLSSVLTVCNMLGIRLQVIPWED